MTPEYLARNKNISDFSDLTGVPVATLRDWNKRKMADGIGQPGPNGHWLYSDEDVKKVRLASIVYGEGVAWKGALFIGHVVICHLTARSLYPAQEYYKSGHFAFLGLQPHQTPRFGTGRSFDEAVANADIVAGPHCILSPFAFVFNIDVLSGMLAD